MWTRWSDSAENILIPDEKDAARGFTHFYGMPVKYYAGIVSHEIRWKKKFIGDLRGKVIRLELYLKNADLYTFRASDSASVVRRD